MTGFLRHVENRNPILVGRFHTDFVTVVKGEPVRRMLQSLDKGREAGLEILCREVGIRDADAGINPGLVNIKSTTVFADDFEHKQPPKLQVGKDWQLGEIESVL